MDFKIKGEVLLIEDSPAAANFAKRLLQRNNISNSVSIKTNGEEGLEYILKMASESFPKLILLDLNMPILGGFGFLSKYEELVTQHQREKCLVVLLSTSIIESDLEKSKQFIDVPMFLTKPLNKDKLKVIVNTYYSKIL